MKWSKLSQWHDNSRETHVNVNGERVTLWQRRGLVLPACTGVSRVRKMAYSFVLSRHTLDGTLISITELKAHTLSDAKSLVK